MVTKIEKKPLGRRIEEIRAQDEEFAVKHPALASAAPDVPPSELRTKKDGAKSEPAPPAEQPAVLIESTAGKVTKKKPKYLKIAAIVDEDTLRHLDLECFQRRMNGEKPTYVSIINEALKLRWEILAKRAEEKGGNL